MGLPGNSLQPGGIRALDSRATLYHIMEMARSYLPFATLPDLLPYKVVLI